MTTTFCCLDSARPGVLARRASAGVAGTFLLAGGGLAAAPATFSAQP